ncbi:MAG: FHA domain-containing protein [Candidatus Eremiobacteraeota bacterium]|nr:FHA domain-containing protein [Candidatus Eremiobacteraeota bacterium]
MEKQVFWLEVLKGRERGQTFRLTADMITVGRRLAVKEKKHNWILLDEPSLSRIHAQLLWDDTVRSYLIVHKSSVKPTIVNGREIKQAVLSHQDRIQMGEVAFRFWNGPVERNYDYFTEDDSESEASHEAPNPRATFPLYEFEASIQEPLISEEGRMFPSPLPPEPPREEEPPEEEDEAAKGKVFFTAKDDRVRDVKLLKFASIGDSPASKSGREAASPPVDSGSAREDREALVKPVNLLKGSQASGSAQASPSFTPLAFSSGSAQTSTQSTPQAPQFTPMNLTRGKVASGGGVAKGRIFGQSEPPVAEQVQDSGSAKLTEYYEIKGKEQKPAPSPFKNIDLIKTEYPGKHFPQMKEMPQDKKYERLYEELGAKSLPGPDKTLAPPVRPPEMHADTESYSDESRYTRRLIKEGGEAAPPSPSPDESRFTTKLSKEDLEAYLSSAKQAPEKPHPEESRHTRRLRSEDLAFEQSLTKPDTQRPPASRPAAPPASRPAAPPGAAAASRLKQDAVSFSPYEQGTKEVLDFLTGEGKEAAKVPPRGSHPPAPKDPEGQGKRPLFQNWQKEAEEMESPPVVQKPAPPPPGAWEILVYKGSKDMEGKKYAIRKESITIGKGASNDVVLPDDQLAESHIKIYFHEGKFHLQKLVKTEPVFINGKILISGSGKHIADGDRIQISSKTTIMLRKKEGR